MAGPLLYFGFTALVLLLLAADLLLQRDRAPSLRTAAWWTAGWIALAAVFGIGIYVFAGRQPALEYAAGYLLEKSLSVDNLFVFALVFRYFAVPVRYQHRVLFYGVLGAIVLRGAFIAAGAALIHFQAVLLAFGLFLIYTGLRFAFQSERRIDPGQSRLIRVVRRFLPVTDMQDGRLFVRVGGRFHATPLLLVILFLEATDLVFAVDSVPAVFGVTHDPFIVYTSNIFAILGLRAMFLVLASAMDRFHALKYGLASVLVFVGLKMVWLDHWAGGRFPIGISLAFIACAIGVSVVFSLFPGARLLRYAAAVVSLLLCVGAVLCAAGPLRAWIPVPRTRTLDEALYISAACYLAWAVALFVSARSADSGHHPAER